MTFSSLAMDGCLKQHVYQQQGVAMISPESSFLNHADNIAMSDIERQRLLVINELGLLSSESVPVFDEATQTAAHFLGSPICILSIADRDRQYFKSAVGLSRIGLMNELATSRQILRQESFCNCVIERIQILAIEDAAHHPDYQNSLLVTRYGIRAYLGVPLVTSQGYCVGTLSIMEVVPRNFSGKDIAFLELIARWCISEFERNQLLKQTLSPSWPKEEDLPPQQLLVPASVPGAEICIVKANLIAQMSQELRTPLTSIIGMASVLSREIYGPLTDKQKEYMDIVFQSSQYIHSLVNEIVELGDLKDRDHDLDLSPVDVEMLCQQSLVTLEQAAERREQTIRLSIEPGRRIWLLDKSKVRQLLYHLVFRVIQSSNAGSTIRVHVSRKDRHLNVSVWTSHPWLGEGLPHTEVFANGHDPSQLLSPMPGAVANDLSLTAGDRLGDSSASNGIAGNGGSGYDVGSSNLLSDVNTDDNAAHEAARNNLGFILSQKLAELHGGSISLQGTLEAGHRYVVVLPQIDSQDIDLELD